MAVFLQSEITTIRNTKPQDLDFVLRLESDEDNARFIIPWSRAEHERAMTDADKAHLVIERTDDHRRIGYMILAGVQNLNRSVELIRIVIAEKGFGYGSEAIRLVQRWVFLELRAHRLWLDVKEHNIRAQHVYHALGFTAEGVLRECLRGADGYESLVVMSILEQEYRGRQLELADTSPE
ncbi:GNAT family N-acetyltransferase [Alicyclobacillus kakegawensis]|uniref:GNAT family N-acetyltransferase n=1 Tax=Alicyclobacillus kakegawensis TaxID=392012 RepID=UPI000836328A|nr:GNAT family protein [Alicyclobacillus kakegawensis]